MLPETVKILATNELEAEILAHNATAHGAKVTGTEIWTGPIPAYGSFIDLDEHTRMSTAEYFFYRKANQLPFEEAVALGEELVGYYATNLTRPDVDEGYVVQVDKRTTIINIFEYLLQVANTTEGCKAFDVLLSITEGKVMP